MGLLYKQHHILWYVYRLSFSFVCPGEHLPFSCLGKIGQATLVLISSCKSSLQGLRLALSSLVSMETVEWGKQEGNWLGDGGISSSVERNQGVTNTCLALQFGGCWLGLLIAPEAYDWPLAILCGERPYFGVSQTFFFFLSLITTHHPKEPLKRFFFPNCHLLPWNFNTTDTHSYFFSVYACMYIYINKCVYI